MKSAITQRQAKVLIRDYLRETGRKGVTSLMRDLHRHAKQPVFAQRTFEKWLEVQDRQLQDKNWELVLDFICSEQFRRVMPYANEGPAEDRLRNVAEGFVALYGKTEHPKGIYILPSKIDEIGREAVDELDGHWENDPNQPEQDVPRTICKIEPVPGTRYAKFAYIALFRSRQISATGLVIYLNSEDIPDHDYCHTFVLQLWRRRDPESGSAMPGELSYLTLGKNQPEFSISSVLNRYFYKETDPIVSRGGVVYDVSQNEETGDNEITGKIPTRNLFKWAFNSTAGNAIVLRRQHDPIAEENEIIDQLLADVLPHGYS
ncbi:MAG: hypothetical protein ABW092_20975 [Candidatus Thiodiazotropha sp.]